MFVSAGDRCKQEISRVEQTDLVDRKPFDSVEIGVQVDVEHIEVGALERKQQLVSVQTHLSTVPRQFIRLNTIECMGAHTQGFASRALRDEASARPVWG